MDEETRFYIARAENAAGPLTDDEVRDALRARSLEPGTRVRLAGSDLWAPAEAWATLATGPFPELPEPPRPEVIAQALPEALGGAPVAVRDALRFLLCEADIVYGPLTGEQVRRGYAHGRYRSALTAIVGTDAWYPASALFASAVAEPAEPEPPARWRAPTASAGRVTRCPTCLEPVPAGADPCPECDEPIEAAVSTGTPSIADDPPGAGWLRMHWRPVVTIGAVTALIVSGVALRYLAPHRFAPRKAASAQTPVPTCASPCWAGEACQLGRCAWQRPNDVGHLPSAVSVAGPFQLPKDVSDALPLDADRFAVALLGGVRVQSSRTGETISLVSEAPQARRLYRVGDAVYATAPQRVYVVEAGSTRLLKTIELGATVGDVVVAASGRRVLASLPTAHAVAILATEYHAEIERIQFGDDFVGPTSADDGGTRALTTTGQVPLPGLRDPAGGAVYAFDPSRLGSNQDRVRASMVGNPASVLMTPDGATGWVALRAEHALVPLTWLPSGAVRQEARVQTCREPEQIELVRSDRRAVVRCNEGRALQIFDLEKGELLHTVPFNARAVDLAVSPDGAQAVVALAGEGGSSVALVDLKTYTSTVVPLGAEPSRVRLAPDGRTALALSDRSKVAWVLR